jgi:hypothetical protein
MELTNFLLVVIMIQLACIAYILSEIRRRL